MNQIDGADYILENI